MPTVACWSTRSRHGRTIPATGRSTPARPASSNCISAPSPAVAGQEQAIRFVLEANVESSARQRAGHDFADRHLVGVLYIRGITPAMVISMLPISSVPDMQLDTASRHQVDRGDQPHAGVRHLATARAGRRQTGRQHSGSDHRPRAARPERPRQGPRQRSHGPAAADAWKPPCISTRLTACSWPATPACSRSPTAWSSTSSAHRFDSVLQSDAASIKLKILLVLRVRADC